MSKIESGSFGEESKEPQIIDSELDKVSQEELKTGKISRRNFLRGALAIGATTAVSSVIGAEKPETDKERLAQEMEALRREAFEFIKETIEKEKIREKLEYLEQTYGNLVNGLFGDVKKVIEITDQIEKDDKDGWEGIFVDKDSPQAVVMASPVLAAKEMWVTLSKEEKLKKQKGLKVNGFQKVAEMFRESPNMTWKGDVNKKVSDLLTKRYPAQWFISTDAVLFVNEERDLPEEYGIEDIEAGLAGQADGGSIYHEKPGKISLFKQFSYDMKNITSILDHEFAHQNDWTRNIILSEPQRIKLLCDATSAFSESKEFFSEYVESIKNDDKQREAYIKVTEYWAEAIEQYMTAGPENYKKTNPTEYALVKKWFDIINDIKE